MKKTIIAITIFNLFIATHLFSQVESNSYKKVFVLGNSLTLGFGTHGMASTDINTDYYYWVQQSLVINNNDLSMNRFSGTTWETGNTTTRLSFLNNTVSKRITGDEDLIVIQLGDNVNTDERKKTLKDDAVKLINWFATKCPKAEIIWVYGWYQMSTNMPLIKTAILETEGCKLVDISQYSRKQYQSAIGNTYIDSNGEVATISSWGVASHPGDLGMIMIASEIINKLDLTNKIGTLSNPIIKITGNQFEITSLIKDVDIFYTIDGSIPSSLSSKYSSPIEVDYSRIIKAVAMKSGYTNSEVSIDSILVYKEISDLLPYEFPRIKINYDGINVEIISINESSNIFYTTDGSIPSMESNLYTEPFIWDGKGTIAAVSILSSEIEYLNTNSDIYISSKQIFDLNGKRITKLIPNQVCIIKEIFSDGSVKTYKVVFSTN
ncbi:chitobiase/beta-hexosaminidase C-terminal domain-containing protein [Saccharicrinis aurantiacus]|uniref:chitobiase/beta-hexosaminidase C-terminal domain-containing protein n=1 Tax=Saccharicrinis aurantiacus TaxID=1849719 RepID=UPI00095023C7|nr:chitobiase/beta-hexosaminidase C-terminal domain-containing protein [Saccharicrinis aurantiacus]